MSAADGGPAFPVSDNWRLASGMTLRDYFAATVLLRSLELCSTNGRAAEEAYVVADAMLKERNK